MTTTSSVIPDFALIYANFRVPLGYFNKNVVGASEFSVHMSIINCIFQKVGESWENIPEIVFGSIPSTRGNIERILGVMISRYLGTLFSLYLINVVISGHILKLLTFVI